MQDSKRNVFFMQQLYQTCLVSAICEAAKGVLKWLPIMRRSCSLLSRRISDDERCGQKNAPDGKRRVAHALA